MFEVLDRAGLARTAKWTAGTAKVTTPNILFHHSSLFPAPNYAELIIRREGGLRIEFSDQPSPPLVVPQGINTPLNFLRQKGEVQEGEGTIVVRGPSDISDARKDNELFVLGNAFELRRDARAFVNAIVSLRKSIGYNRLIYAPGLMDNTNLALLTYMGVDLFDSSLLLYQAARGRVQITEGSLQAEEATWLVEGKEDVVRHNLQAAWNELKLVRHMLKIGRLRELVETRANATPWAVAALRILDLEHYDFVEGFTPVVGPPFYCNSKQSLFRPDVWRFRRRIMERYRPASHKKVLLLIPCSAKKPYSTSKSHHMFSDTMQFVPNTGVVQELIITSPLGAVPRELELYYPASQYDIPVTGNWDREEVAMVQELVRKVVSYGFQKVICHLGVESQFVKPVVDCVDTAGESPTSKESLCRLQEELTAACGSVDKVPRTLDRVETMRSAAVFQFGEGGSSLLDDCAIVGNYPYLKVMRGSTQLGMLTPDRGMISLTMDGGMALLEQRVSVVEMGDFDLTGNLFAVGVVSADPQIRVGDEVLIVRGGELEGVGVANMSGREMADSKRGEAVRVRHKRKR